MSSNVNIPANSVMQFLLHQSQYGRDFSAIWLSYQLHTWPNVQHILSFTKCTPFDQLRCVNKVCHLHNSVSIRIS